MSYGLTNLDSGDRIERGGFTLLSSLGCKTYGSWGKYFCVHAYLVCDTDIRGGCPYTRTIRGWRRYSISHMILGILETVGFKGGLRFEIWIEIQGRVRMGLVALKVPGEDL